MKWIMGKDGEYYMSVSIQMENITGHEGEDRNISLKMIPRLPFRAKEGDIIRAAQGATWEDGGLNKWQIVALFIQADLRDLVILPKDKRTRTFFKSSRQLRWVMRSDVDILRDLIHFAEAPHLHPELQRLATRTAEKAKEQSDGTVRGESFEEWDQKPCEAVLVRYFDHLQKGSPGWSLDRSPIHEIGFRMGLVR